MPRRERFRLVATLVGDTMRWQRMPGVPEGPWSGTVRRVRATVEVAADRSAGDPSGLATDIAIQLTEGGRNTPAGAFPASALGGPTATSIPLDWPLGTFGTTTIDIPDIDRDFFLPAGERFQVGLAVDAAPLPPVATCVVTIEIEQHS